MHHTGTISKTDSMRPFHAQCSCGTAGDFFDEDPARSFLQAHFAKQGGIATSELKEGITKPVLPTAHVGGVGTMPATYATQPATAPPPPPAPPNSSEAT